MLHGVRQLTARGVGRLCTVLRVAVDVLDQDGLEEIRQGLQFCDTDTNRLKHLQLEKD